MHEGRPYATFNSHALIENTCISCHMPRANRTFIAVVEDAGGVIDVKAFDTVCSKCHADKQKLLSALNDAVKGYEASPKVVEQLLAGKGIYYNIGAYPCFYKTPDPAQHVTANAFTAWPDRDALGAASTSTCSLTSQEPSSATRGT
ncbi:MAG: hypothetical protein QXU97_03700 [Fervidicoccaceae archaeon]